MKPERDTLLAGILIGLVLAAVIFIGLAGLPCLRTPQACVSLQLFAPLPW